jgi:Fe-S cluster biogenesis protein NfuA
MAVAEDGLPDLVERVSGLLESLSAVLAYHGGGVVLESVSPEGKVRVSFTGMCSHCSLRPVTLAAILRPALDGLDGVTAVETVGFRISEEAERRLSGAIHPLEMSHGSVSPGGARAAAE